MIPVQSRRNFSASLSAKLRRNGLNPRRTGSSTLGRGIRLTPSTGFCLGVDIYINAYDEADAQEFVDVITALLDEWGNPYSVGEIRDEMAAFGHYAVSIHVESTRDDFRRCGADRAKKVRALADSADQVADEAEQDPGGEVNNTPGFREALRARAVLLRGKADKLDPPNPKN